MIYELFVHPLDGLLPNSLVCLEIYFISYREPFGENFNPFTFEVIGEGVSSNRESRSNIVDLVCYRIHQLNRSSSFLSATIRRSKRNS